MDAEVRRLLTNHMYEHEPLVARTIQLIAESLALQPGLDVDRLKSALLDRADAHPDAAACLEKLLRDLDAVRENPDAFRH